MTAPMSCHLLLETPRLQLPPPLPRMTHPMGCKMIVMAVAPPIRCKVVVVMMEMRPVRLRLPHQKGCLQEVCTEEFKTNNGSSLLSYKFFYKEEWGW
jgi:hypothetical protein